MSGRTIAAIRGLIQQMIRDEFQVGVVSDFEVDELDIHIGSVLQEISEHSPYLVKETLTTSASRDLSISAIIDLLWVYKVEYKVDKTPKEFKKFSVMHTTLSIDCSTTPTAGESLYAYCAKLHTLSNSASTLTPQLERVLIQGVAAYTALSKARTFINEVNVGGGNMLGQMRVWGLDQLALYKQGLNKITESEDFSEYSRS